MPETFAALLLAHLVADFLLQPGWISQGKRDREASAIAAHMAVVAVSAALALGAVTPWAGWAVAGITLLHGLTDLLRSFLPARRLWPFLLDQTVHIVTLGIVAALWPGLWGAGAWMSPPAPLAAHWPLPPLPGLAALMALAAGLILATRAGGFAVGYLMEPWRDADLPRGLRNGGTLIGLLERGLVFLLVMVGQPGAIGFLVAAKSVLRFETTSKDQRAGEYVIIGTLASFGWALAAAYATVALLSALHPLGIPLRTP